MSCLDLSYIAAVITRRHTKPSPFFSSVLCLCIAPNSGVAAESTI